MSKIKALLSLTKPRILTLVLITTALGYFLGFKATYGVSVGSWWPLLNCLLGTTLTCAGAAVLNNFVERDTDKLMERTNKRALPRGIVEAHEALFLGVILVLSGVLILVSYNNLLTGFLALLSAFLYVLVYTPLKRITWLNTAVGAIPGALPPMGGWAAACGSLGEGAWILFAIMYIWQHPHFYSIAWIYREDYARAGFKMLPVIDPDGRRTFRQVIAFSVLIIPVSLLPLLINMSGFLYGFIALGLGAYFLRASLHFANSHSNHDARALLRASIIYLPLLFLGIVFSS